MPTPNTPPTSYSTALHPSAAATGISFNYILVHSAGLPTGWSRTLFAIAAVVAVIVPVATIQRHAGDEWPIALAKSLIAACVTLVPCPVMSIITASWALTGIIDSAARRSGDPTPSVIHTTTIEEN